MARTVTLVQQMLLSAIETIDSTTAPAAGTNGGSLTFDQYNLANRLNATTSPATYGHVVDLSFTSIGTDKDFDLTAAVVARGVSGADTVDLTGKKLIALIIQIPTTNIGTVTIKPHPTTNPYNLFGASGLMVLGKGRQLQLGIAAGVTLDSPAVAAGAKVIRFTVGTVGDKWNVLAVFGSDTP